MSGDKFTFTTPTNFSSRFTSSIARPSTSKRDSLAAELERGASPSVAPRAPAEREHPDPRLSTAKRQQRTQAFGSHIAHASLERQLVAAQTTKTELESKLKEKDVLIERLESDRRWLAEREKEEREEKEREREEHLEEKRKFESDVRTLRSSLTALREQHADLEEEHSSHKRNTAQTIASQKSQISTLSHQVSLLTDEVAEFKRIADERSHAFEDLQAEFDALSASQESFVQSSVEEENWAVVREELHRQANYLRTLEATNAKMSAELTVLREKHASVEVLKEQKRELERKARGTEELHEMVAKLEAELEAARREREEWASTSASPSKVPVSVTQSLSTLRLTYARLLEEHGSNVVLLHRRETELAEAEQRDTEARGALEKLQAEVRILKDKSARREHEVKLAEREVSFLQAMVTSFTAEEASQEGIKIEDLTSEHVQQLESLVKDYKATIQNLEDQIEALSNGTTAVGHSHDIQKLQDELESERVAKLKAQKALENAEAASEKQLEQIEELEQTLFDLRGEVGAGRHLPPGVRILCMQENPAQQWTDLRQAAMDCLKSENQALLKRLKDLEESGARGGDANISTENLVPRQSLEAANQEIEQLKDVVKQREKRLLRLQEIYQSKSKEFKAAIASIMGLRFTFYPNGQPTGAGDEGMKMQLVDQGDGGPEDLPEMVQYWVEQRQCIPAFMASITLECFEKQKRRQREQVA
ncbi:Spindle assembly checkpoint component mad1 [Grifola frondosa]|uniref:Spindle assembly checkpoint component MAD1 n=1 Tax=Grifola frondosa TaxID=5627 RepID=A0A1C7MD66_GRIFR|nr:Spindle assembly checkpoint component mad1 [Grifola frondosa]